MEHCAIAIMARVFSYLNFLPCLTNIYFLRDIMLPAAEACPMPAIAHELALPSPVVSELLSSVVLSPEIPEVIPHYMVVLVIATAIMFVWATHTSPEAAASLAHAPCHSHRQWSSDLLR